MPLLQSLEFEYHETPFSYILTFPKMESEKILGRGVQKSYKKENKSNF